MNTKGPGVSARSQQDIFGGLLLMAIAGLALYLVNHLPAAGRVGFASGTAPRLFAYGLMALGAWIAIAGFIKEGPAVAATLLPAVLGVLVFFGVMKGIDLGFDALARSSGLKILDKISAMVGFVVAAALVAWVNGFPREDRYGMQGPLAILGAVLFFAVMIRDLGLAVTGVPMVMMAAFASAERNYLESFLFALGMTVFCAILFPITLGQPIPLWPTL